MENDASALIARNCSDPLYREASRRMIALFARAQRLPLKNPDAVALATSAADGLPSVRMVLAKSVDERGIVFYTNANSRKGRELQARPYAALCFYWEALDRQLRVEGPVLRVDDSEADAYWARRPRESQIGAWVSRQSHELASREELETAFARRCAEFAGQSVPRPPYWVGFLVVPQRIEFWESRPARLHHREVFERTDDGWRRKLLYP
ncbi:MAG: pyridoxamine 5'-phosphate oxidase [Planctomycetota bacterium]|nr:MAG: pyridoxamine 5'-phosphate oxidase [Planctomycetota bacterium]